MSKDIQCRTDHVFLYDITLECGCRAVSVMRVFTLYLNPFFQSIELSPVTVDRKGEFLLCESFHPMRVFTLLICGVSPEDLEILLVAPKCWISRLLAQMKLKYLVWSFNLFLLIWQSFHPRVVHSYKLFARFNMMNKVILNKHLTIYLLWFFS